MLGRFNEALLDFQSALPLSPKDPEIHDFLGRCWMSLGDENKALLHFRESARLRPPAVTIDDDALKVPAFRFKHDLEQLIAMEKKQILGTDARASLVVFKTVWSDSNGATQVISVAWQSEHFDPVSLFYRHRINLEPGSKIPDGALNSELDGDVLSFKYQNADPQIIVIDDFLSPAALQAMRDYCNYSTIWRRDMAEGYLATTLPEDFACPLIFQISDELTNLLPTVIKNHRLAYSWAFKYDSTLKGVPVHADDAVVNVNFWITADEANRSPKTGGLIVWDKKPPPIGITKPITMSPMSTR